MSTFYLQVLNSGVVVINDRGGNDADASYSGVGRQPAVDHPSSSITDTTAVLFLKGKSQLPFPLNSN